MNRRITSALLSLTCAAVLCGCSSSSSTSSTSSDTTDTSATADSASDTSTDTTTTETVSSDGSTVTTFSPSGTGILDTTDMFTERDLTQTVDTSSATAYTVSDGQDITITEEGTYVISGSASNVTIYVEADDTAKVQIVLDGVSVTNDTSPVIYVKSADKVFVTLVNDNSLSVTGTFASDDENNPDAVIFSKSDLTLNGTGSLTITSTENGISGHDDLKITGGTYDVTASADAFEAHNSIRIAGGTFTVNAGKDAFHSEDTDDDTVGYVYIYNGTFTINASDDGIQATTALEIDGGTFNISSVEGLEGTYVQINDGDITISASDDGINATSKSTAYDVVLEINGGTIDITMGSGDTDALDSNGSLVINGGTVNITAQYAFDFDTTGELNGGTVTVNGEQVTAITNSMMGGGGMGGNSGGMSMGGPGSRG